MAFIDRISEDLTAAMRSKDQVKLGTLRMAKAALMNREVERGRALDDAESQQVIASLIKQRRDSFEQFQAAGRIDLAEKEQAEISVLEAYLPPPMDAAELERIVDEAVTETGASSPRDMGRVMKSVMTRLAGATVDGKAVSELVKRKLAGA
ncbi:MAG TPA: GatB/YqeY domain-containing protein [Vicinamibacterales bacterium]